MLVEILRGKDHIGGNIIRIALGETAVLLNCGALLPEIGGKAKEDDFDMARIGKVDAVFLTHHHGDHAGLLDRLPPSVKLYTSPETAVFMDAMDEFLGRPLRTAARETHILREGTAVSAGGMEVLPIRVEHSADGAMMFLVRGGGKALLYTGDFKVAADVPVDGIDLLICEGTMLTRDGQAYADEEAVERALREVMEKTSGRVFVLQSSANFPRVRSVMRAAGDRPVLQDIFMKFLMERTGNGDLAAPYGFVWIPFEFPDRAYDRIARQYLSELKAVSYKKIAQFPNAVVFLRPTMADMLKILAKKGTRIYRDALVFSMWRGYEKEPQTAALLEFFQSSGVTPRYIHTSGHADRGQIQKLIQNVRPKRIACVHSEDASLIAGLAGGIPVEDGVQVEL